MDRRGKDQRVEQTKEGCLNTSAGFTIWALIQSAGSSATFASCTSKANTSACIRETLTRTRALYEFIWSLNFSIWLLRIFGVAVWMLPFCFGFYLSLFQILSFFVQITLSLVVDCLPMVPPFANSFSYFFCSLLILRFYAKILLNAEIHKKGCNWAYTYGGRAWTSES